MKFEELIKLEVLFEFACMKCLETWRWMKLEEKFDLGQKFCVSLVVIQYVKTF